MGLLDMSRGENSMWMRFIAEAAKLRGQPCILYQIDHAHHDLHNDKDIIYKEPVLFNILFEDNPKTILKKMNWFSEDEELPYVAYLVGLDESYADVEIAKDCRIDTRSIQVKQSEETQFLISSVKGSSVNPVFWICKLVPYRPKSIRTEVVDPESPNSTEMGYHFIQRKSGSHL